MVSPVAKLKVPLSVIVWPSLSATLALALTLTPHPCSRELGRRTSSCRRQD